MSTIKYLALGDSYTIGEDVDFKENLPHHLVSFIEKKHTNQEVEIGVLAKTGWTSDELIEAMNNHNFQEKYDYISLLIGVNNQYRNLSIAQFKSDINYLCEWIKSKVSSPKNVIIISIPDWGQTPFGLKHDKHTDPLVITQTLEKYNLFLSQMAQEYGFQYHSIFELSQQQGLKKVGEDFPYLTSDLLHYNSIAYQEWAKQTHWFWEEVSH